MKGTTTNSTISDAIKMRMSWTDKHPHTNNGNKKKIQLSEKKWENTAFAYSPLVILQEIDNFKLFRVIFCVVIISFLRKLGSAFSQFLIAFAISVHVLRNQDLAIACALLIVKLL